MLEIYVQEVPELRGRTRTFCSVTSEETKIFEITPEEESKEKTFKSIAKNAWEWCRTNNLVPALIMVWYILSCNLVLLYE